MSVAAEVAAALLVDRRSPWRTGNPDPIEAAESLCWALETANHTAVLLDDVHAADPSSRTALSLALRRAVLSSALVVVSGRRVPSVTAFAEGFPVRELHGLPAEAAAQLLASSSDCPVHPSVSLRLVEAASGNPLALKNLPHALSPQQLSATEPLPADLPLVGDLAAVFARQLPPPETPARELLDRVAVCSDDSWGTFDASADALDELREQSLIDFEDGRLTLRHPLLRNAVLAAMSDRRRRELNLQFAEDLRLPENVRILHRARGTLGPDEALVDSMVDAARRLEAEHGLEVAARILDHAIPLTADSARRGHLLLESAELLGAAGDAGGARQRLETVLDEPRWATLHTGAAIALATLEAVDGAPAAAQQRLSESVTLAEPARVATVYCRMAIPLGMLGAVRQLHQYARLAVELAPTASVDADIAAVIFAHAASALDEGWAKELSEPFDSLDLGAVVRADPTAALHVGRTMSIAERYEEAAARLTALIAKLRSGGARASLAMAYGALGETFVRASRFDDARVSLDEAVALSFATGQRAFAPFWLSLRARVAAIAGDDSAARRDFDLGFAISDEQSTFGARYFLLANAGLVAVAAHRFDDAVESLGECLAFEQAVGPLTPQLARWHIDLVETYLALGRRDDAEAVVDHLRCQGDSRPLSRWTTATTLRATALVRDEDRARAEDLLHEALAIYDPHADAFDRGRTLTDLAKIARSRADRERAAAQARYLFRRIGATAFAARIGTAPNAGVETLTDAERRVLDEVAKGLTNDQIARRLHLSSKTVANHLYRVYRKLGVASRTEATRQLLLRDGQRASPRSISR